MFVLHNNCMNCAIQNDMEKPREAQRSSLLKIAELERVSGASRSVIHFYLNSGLLPPPIRRGPKLHFYGPEHVRRLREIAEMRKAGASLAEIGRKFARRQLVRSRREATRTKGELPVAPRSRRGLRDALLDAAARAFVERGYDGVHVEDVARSVGVSKAKLYEVFQSKAALFVECLDRLRHVVWSVEQRSGLSSPDLSFDEEGRVRAGAVLSRFAPYRMMTNLLTQAAFGDDADLARRARAALHGLVLGAKPMFDRAIAAGDCRPFDTELAAYMTWGALIAVGDRLALDDEYTVERALDAYLDFVTYGTRVRRER
jgi:AcrR family transcriptional regulator/predicted DNA-binding transcriptional regulator AlpA